MKRIRSVAAVIASAFLLCSLALQAQQRQTKQLKIPTGKTSISASGSITGYQDIDYIVNAAAGQTMTVTLKTNKTSNYFLVYGPADKETAIYNSDAGDQTWTKTLDQSGDYTVRVYLYRNAARNNVKANFTVTVTVKNAETRPGDAKVAGTQFNATGQLKAALVSGAAPGSSMADFGVIRYANGNADIHITNANSQKRVFKFSKGEFECSLPAGGKLTYNRSSADEWKVTLNGQETYLIPDVVIVGG
jgi:hypothetical protein